MALIEAKADIHKTCDDGNSPLHVAINAVHGPCALELIINARGDVNERGRGTMTPLMMAADCSSVSCTKTLLDAGADISLVSETPWYGTISALTQAIYRSHNSGGNDIIELLINHRADVSSCVGDDTPLMKAVKNYSEDLVKRLLAAEADIARTNPAGETALDLAKQMKFEAVINLIEEVVHSKTRSKDEPARYSVTEPPWSDEELQAVAHELKRFAYDDFDQGGPRIRSLYEQYGQHLPVNYSEDRGCTLLHSCVTNYNCKTALALIEAKADICKKNDDGNTPLHDAINAVHGAYALELIINARGDVNERGRRTMTPLMMAADCSGVKCAKALLDAGADLSIVAETPSHGTITAFTMAMYRSSRSSFGNDMLELLISNRADVSSRVGDETPLMKAIKSYSVGLMKRLLEARADISTTNSVGQKALDVAKKQKFKDAIDLLEATQSNA